MRRRTLITGRARNLRKSMSDAEVLLWSRLRGRSADRPTFRRQHPIVSVIVDFYCPSARLAIEVDGSSHWNDEAIARDEGRDHWLNRQGVEVMRIPASRVYRELSEVVDEILRTAEARRTGIQQSPPAPSIIGSSADGPPPAAARGR